MIHEVGQDMLAQFQARGVPFAVVDGPEIIETTTYARERVVIEHDPNGDDFAAARHSQQNTPPLRYTRKIGVKITIYAKATRPSAMYWEHKRRAEQVLDQVLCCLYQVAKSRQNLPNFKSGKFVYPEDLKASERPGGAKYELLLTFDRGVFDLPWSGIPAQQVTVTPQMIAAGGPAVTFAAAGHTITRSFGSWLLDGFLVGQSIIVSGSTSNNGTLGPITALTDTVMTFGSGITNEGPITGVTITGTGAVIHTSGTASGGGQGPETIL
jgi:hypothetical protein